MTSEAFLSRLQTVKRSGNGWMARCPAHEDRKASLSIREGTDGRILLHCHAGCSTEAIVAALGLNLADLFPPHTGNGTEAKPRIVTTYDYTDETGTLLFQCVRYEPKGSGSVARTGRGPASGFGT